jgi:hypothetical protein
MTTTTTTIEERLAELERRLAALEAWLRERLDELEESITGRTP